MMENDQYLAKKYHDPGTTQAQKSKFWEQVRRRLSAVSGIDMMDPKFPDVAQIRKKWNYRVTKMREKSEKHKLEVCMKKKHASGTGGGQGLSPIHDLDGDELDDDLQTENIVADPYKESPLVLRKTMTVDPPGHQPINILSKAIDSCQLFTTEELVSDGNTLEEGTYTVIDGQFPGISYAVHDKNDMIQSTPVQSTNLPVLTPPPNSPPYKQSTI